MCYFAITDYECGDWKWGNMMERCPRQHRIGETCGAKLVHDDHVTKSSEKCKACQDIEVKRRRLVRVEDSIRRWTPEREKFAASLDKAKIERDDLIEKIKSLHSRRQSVQFRNGSERSGQGLGGVSGSPLSMMTDRGNSYTYSTHGPSQVNSGYSGMTAASGVSQIDQYAPMTKRSTPYSTRR